RPHRCRPLACLLVADGRPVRAGRVAHLPLVFRGVRHASHRRPAKTHEAKRAIAAARMWLVSGTGSPGAKSANPKSRVSVAVQGPVSEGRPPRPKSDPSSTGADHRQCPLPGVFGEFTTER